MAIVTHCRRLRVTLKLPTLGLGIYPSTNPHWSSVVKYARGLLNHKEKRVHISGPLEWVEAKRNPNIKYLKLLFDSMGLEQPKIGTVEEFQGQERPIILISTVRSGETYLQEDIRHSLGFVKNPKRLNVIITRAQVSAILFCNPHLLSRDHLWNSVISYAVREDKYIGCDLPTTLHNSSECNAD